MVEQEHGKQMEPSVEPLVVLPPSRLRRLLPWAFRAGLSALLLGFVASRVDLGALLSRAGEMSLPLVGLATVLLGMNLVFAAVRLQVILRAVRASIPFGDLLIIYASSHFFTTFIPSGLGGDVYRGAKIYQRARTMGTSVFSVLLERAAALLSMFSLALAGLLIAAPYLGGQVTMLALVSGAFIVLVLVFFLLSHRLGSLLALLGRLVPPLAPLASRVARALEGVSPAASFRPMVMVFAISLLTHLMMVLAVYLMAMALGQNIPFRFFLAFVPLITVFMMLPLTVGGLGLREMGYVHFFPQVGMLPEVAVQLSLLYMGVTILLALVGGLVYLLLSGRLDRPESLLTTDTPQAPEGASEGM